MSKQLPLSCATLNKHMLSSDLILTTDFNVNMNTGSD